MANHEKNYREGIRQGYPLAPYLFSIIGKSSTTWLRKQWPSRSSKGSSYLANPHNSLYPSMHSPTHSPLEEKKYIVTNLVRLLNKLSLATCFGINWNKIAAYWQSPFRAKPTWLNIFKRKWAQEGDLPKLFEMAFALSLDTWDIDNCLNDEIQKKIRHQDWDVFHSQEEG